LQLQRTHWVMILSGTALCHAARQTPACLFDTAKTTGVGIFLSPRRVLDAIPSCAKLRSLLTERNRDRTNGKKRLSNAWTKTGWIGSFRRASESSGSARAFTEGFGLLSGSASCGRFGKHCRSSVVAALLLASEATIEWVASAVFWVWQRQRMIKAWQHGGGWVDRGRTDRRTTLGSYLTLKIDKLSLFHAGCIWKCYHRNPWPWARPSWAELGWAGCGYHFDLDTNLKPLPEFKHGR